MNRIEIYEGNTVTILCPVLNADGSDKSLTGFTSTLYVKKKKTDLAVVITKTGVNVGNDITFSLLTTDTDIEVGLYWYEIRIVSLTETITVVQDEFYVMESLAIPA